MTCPHCGKYNTSNGKECEYCGKPLNVVTVKKPVMKNLGQSSRISVRTTGIATKSAGESRLILGIISAFLGIIGLFVGMLFFDEQEDKRKSFVIGWIICTVVLLVITIILVSSFF